jgi:hypothetical protein
MNGVKHGLTARALIIADEDPAEFDQLDKGLKRNLNRVHCFKESLWSAWPG